MALPCVVAVEAAVDGTCLDLQPAFEMPKWLPERKALEEKAMVKDSKFCTTSISGGGPTHSAAFT